MHPFLVAFSISMCWRGVGAGFSAWLETAYTNNGGTLLVSEVKIKFVKDGYLITVPDTKPTHFFYTAPEKCLAKISELLNAWEKPQC
jgi:hypothetical protein